MQTRSIRRSSSHKQSNKSHHNDKLISLSHKQSNKSYTTCSSPYINKTKSYNSTRLSHPNTSQYRLLSSPMYESLKHKREDLHQRPLDINRVDVHPICQFVNWAYDLTIADAEMPQRMVISTIKNGPNNIPIPSSRPVLMKDIIVPSQRTYNHHDKTNNNGIFVGSDVLFRINTDDNNTDSIKQPDISTLINAFPVVPLSQHITTDYTTTSKPSHNIPSDILHLLNTRGGFTFATNYTSNKGCQIDTTPTCSLTFHWLELERVVRVEGNIYKAPSSLSDVYHNARPRASRVSALTSHQSHQTESRQILEERYNQIDNALKHGNYSAIPGCENAVRPENASIEEWVPRPDHWGGYIIIPHTIEFWQGRRNRFHERILYTFNTETEQWDTSYLEP